MNKDCNFLNKWINILGFQITEHSKIAQLPNISKGKWKISFCEVHISPRNSNNATSGMFLYCNIN